jgi:hypothetical protein
MDRLESGDHGKLPLAPASSHTQRSPPHLRIDFSSHTFNCTYWEMPYKLSDSVLKLLIKRTACTSVPQFENLLSISDDYATVPQSERFSTISRLYAAAPPCHIIIITPSFTDARTKDNG